ncbi:MAG: response regulator transcription factor [Acetivibrio sp.]
MFCCHGREGELIKNILIVEDDKALSNGIVFALESEKITILQCFDVDSARSAMAAQTFDLILLDINLPDGNGLNFLKELRKTRNVPVIFLTAKDLEEDIVVGLEMGADDYITKPFSLAVLRARVHTQLRKQVGAKTYVQDDFCFDFDRMEFFKGGKPIELSKTEQRLLKFLIDNKGNTLRRATLVDRIWTDGGEYVDENALSVTVKRLRDKLEENPAKPLYLKTVYGIGYTWAVM